ncbi:MAG: MEKHLA domain-containing protein [Pseudomonadota bacterium]|nr:MEKHLA domain-containing protein [Pseudomonadota bacterium]
MPLPDSMDFSYIDRMLASFRRWTGKDLVAPASPEALYYAPFVVVSHGTEADPVFRYANLAAQRLWETPWEKFITLPSRLSAEPDARPERQALLERAARDGYADHYSGVRVTASGRRFAISNCLLWNVLGETGDKIGQAATFSRWEWL